MSDWWSRKLGNTNVQPQHGTIARPAQPASVPQPVYPQQGTQYPANTVVEQAPEQQYNMEPGRQEVLDPNRDRNAEVPLGEALRLWKGGEAQRREGGLSCPDCGSRTGYTAYSGSGAGSVRVGGNAPKPHCFECGYNGDYMQGNPAQWGA